MACHGSPVRTRTDPCGQGSGQDGGGGGSGRVAEQVPESRSLGQFPRGVGFVHGMGGGTWCAQTQFARLRPPLRREYNRSSEVLACGANGAAQVSDGESRMMQNSSK
jgi:hypothetical protein